MITEGLARCKLCSPTFALLHAFDKHITIGRAKLKTFLKQQLLSVDTMSKKTSKADKAWMERYKELVEFKRTHGHTAVSLSPRDEEYTEFRMSTDSDQDRLAGWVSRQRKLRKQGKLRDDRVQLLDDIEFYWCPQDRIWDERYENVLRVFSKKKKKDCHDDEEAIDDSQLSNIPSLKSQIVKGENYPLSQSDMEWVDKQRVQYMLRQLNKHNAMNDRRISKMEKIPGFSWWKDDDDKKRLERVADGVDLRWTWRKIPNHKWMEVRDAIRKAREENLETGNPCIATIQRSLFCVLVVAKEEDGTLYLMHGSDFSHMDEDKETGVVVFDCQNKLASGDYEF